MLINQPKSILQTVHSTLKDAFVSVRCNKLKDYSPRINFSYSQYTGKCLNDEELINKKVLIKYNPNDLRELSVFRENGVELLGKVYAPSCWLERPFTLKTRNLIKDLIKENKFETNLIKGAQAEYLRYIINETEKRPSMDKTREIIRLLAEGKFTDQEISEIDTTKIKNKQC